MGKATPRGLDPAISDFYQRTPEEARLEQGPFQLEEARTRELIRRYARAALIFWRWPSARRNVLWTSASEEIT